MRYGLSDDGKNKSNVRGRFNTLTTAPKINRGGWGTESPNLAKGKILIVKVKIYRRHMEKGKKDAI